MRIFEELFESLRLGVHFFIRSYFWMIIYQLWIIFYFKTQVLSSYNRRFKFKSISIWWTMLKNSKQHRMTSKAFEIRNVYRKRGKTREYKEKRGEKILCIMAPRVKFLSFLIVQLSLFRTVGLLFEKNKKREI